MYLETPILNYIGMYTGISMLLALRLDKPTNVYVNLCFCPSLNLFLKFWVYTANSKCNTNSFPTGCCSYWWFFSPKPWVALRIRIFDNAFDFLLGGMCQKYRKKFCRPLREFSSFKIISCAPKCEVATLPLNWRD